MCCGDGLARIYNFLCIELNADKPILDPAEVLYARKNFDELLFFYFI